MLVTMIQLIQGSVLLFCLQVETIGDAYMVVGGLPEFTETHADLVTSMAFGMIDVARTVMSACDKEPIQVCIPHYHMVINHPSRHVTAHSIVNQSSRNLKPFHSAINYPSRNVPPHSVINHPCRHLHTHFVINPPCRHVPPHSVINHSCRHVLKHFVINHPYRHVLTHFVINHRCRHVTSKSVINHPCRHLHTLCNKPPMQAFTHTL